MGYLQKTDTVHSLHQCFSSFCGFVHPFHRLLHSHSAYCECMANNSHHSHRVFIVRPRCLPYSSFTACFPTRSKSATTCNNGLITDSVSQNVFFVSSAHGLFQKRKGETFCQPESFTIDEWREFYCSHI